MAETAGSQARSYGRAASLLTVAIASAGLLTYGFFALASHNLERNDYGEIVVLWSAVFIVVSTAFRPIEQLLARTVAELEAHGQPVRHALVVASSIQLALAGLFVAAALALREPLENDLLSGDPTLYWVMIGAVLAFGASFFTRGLLAGERRFGLYGLLIMLDGAGRFSFAFALAVGIAEGRDFIALGVALAPAISLAVVPLALRREARRARRGDPAGGPGAAATAGELPRFTLTRGGGFAAAVLLIMLSEQIFLNSGPLLVRAAEGPALAGFIFNVLMIARAPVVLFQAISASLLPHLTRLRSHGDETSAEAFRLSVRVTILVTAGFGAIVSLLVLAAGPDAMQLLFGEKFEYERGELVIVAAGMGLYLTAATLNQAALAQGQARRAAACWVACAIGFLAWNLLGPLSEVRLVETGYAGAAALLCALLYAIYRRPRPRDEDIVRPGSPEEIELRLAAADEGV